MAVTADPISTHQPKAQAAQALFQAHQQSIFVSTDRLFACLMAVQWLGGIATAIWISPRTWAGLSSSLHPHVWFAVFLGGAISIPPIVLALTRPGQAATRYVIATAQALTSALLIHLTGGRLETHFHVFGSLAILAGYRDWRVLVPATIVVAADHLLRGIFWPASVYGVLTASQWRWLEHAGWVVFEDVFLVLACLRSEREMRAIAQHRASLEQTNTALRDEVQERQRVEKVLQETQVALENAVEGISRLDQHGRYVTVNRAYAAVVGYEPEEMIGKSWEITVHPDDRTRMEEVYRQMIPEGKVEAEARGLRRDGSIFHKQVVMVCARDESGQLIGHYCFMKDISERKRVEEALRDSERHTRLIIDTALDAVIAVDARGHITEWNPQAHTMFGWSRHETVGRTLPELIIPQQHRAAHVEGLKRFLATGVGPVLNKRIEIVALHRDGHEFPVELAVSPAGKDENLTFSAFVRDITQRKEAEAELTRLKDAAESANRAKSDFLARMSHEIRTPLNGVVGMTELLLASEFQPRQRRQTQLLKSSADALLNVINDILDFSKIEAGKLELAVDDFDLRLAIEDVVEMLAPRAVEKNIELVCHIDPMLPNCVRGDVPRFKQVLINLVNNAVKFTAEGEVVVRVTLEDTDDRHTTIKIAISDTGIGIAPRVMDRLFKPFSQVDVSTTRKYGGTGLGLIIAKQLVELMGGHIAVESTPGRGSTFWFTMVLETAAMTVPQHQHVPTDLRGLRVLAVDDHATFREVVQNYLATLKLDAQTAADGQSALDALRRAAAAGQPFRVVLVDLIMPEMSGLELIEAIRNDALLHDTVVVTLSGMVDQPDAQSLHRLNVNGHLVKPLRQSLLFDTLIRALAGQAFSDGAGDVPRAPLTTLSERSEHKTSRILLAEDNEVNQVVASEILATAGYTCDIVNSGREAVEAVLDGSYDLVLMDCQMPEMDGFEAVRIIREHRVTSRAGGPLPIVAVTANAVKGDRDRCIEAGMNGYITKPLDPRLLIETVDATLNPARDHDAPQVQSEPTQRAEKLDVAFDVDRLLKRCLGNVALVSRLLETFETHARNSLQSVADARATGCFDQIARAAHSLKGAAANLSADMLVQAAGQLECDASAEQIADLDDQISRLQAEVDRCLASIPAVAAAAQERGGAVSSRQ